jgi:biotin--protein ligase
VNVLNEAPIMSLAQLVLNEECSVPTMEGTAAAILVTFQKMWTTFIANKGSFEPFMDLYLERWLHSYVNQ